MSTGFFKKGGAAPKLAGGMPGSSGPSQYVSRTATFGANRDIAAAQGILKAAGKSQRSAAYAPGPKKT
jgi:hypothetical protein